MSPENMPEIKNSYALAVMVKSPEPLAVKTRLTPPISPEDAAGLYGCLIDDTFTNLMRLQAVDIYCAYAPADAEEKLRERVPVQVCLFPQEGADLGERLLRVFKRLFGLGYAAVAVIGSDSPDLPIGYIEEALGLLADDGSHRLVLGPARDGGYYLIAMNALTEAPFSGISWSTPLVLTETIANAQKDSMSVTLLRRWHDIDEPVDLHILEDNPMTPASARFMRDRGLPGLLKSC